MNLPCQFLSSQPISDTAGKTKQMILSVLTALRLWPGVYIHPCLEVYVGHRWYEQKRVSQAFLALDIKPSLVFMEDYICVGIGMDTADLPRSYSISVLAVAPGASGLNNNSEVLDYKSVRINRDEGPNGTKYAGEASPRLSPMVRHHDGLNAN
ncbi:hypothetical protein B0H17DRAFT_1142183 [Mycena rosella]|uniref:Uncharacterized protein n=1 Tax=Mycena rosella TaxID=1033263 RepID=A0AAD7G9M9_MYCRO|nr:hypothetical protein B0H17DRAFT_1142183 [Mycena rosella]